jgi:hypothetical protein
MQLHPLPTRSILLAPLASIPAMTLAGIGTSSADIVPDVFFGLLFSIVLAVPLAWLGMVLVGLPLFILLRNVPLWLMLPVAGAVGALVPCLLFIQGAPNPTYIMLGTSGLAVGVTACLLRPSQQPMQTEET